MNQRLTPTTIDDIVRAIVRDELSALGHAPSEELKRTMMVLEVHHLRRPSLPDVVVAYVDLAFDPPSDIRELARVGKLGCRWQAIVGLTMLVSHVDAYAIPRAPTKGSRVGLALPIDTAIQPGDAVELVFFWESQLKVEKPDG